MCMYPCVCRCVICMYIVCIYMYVYMCVVYVLCAFMCVYHLHMCVCMYIEAVIFL